MVNIWKRFQSKQKIWKTLANLSLMLGLSLILIYTAQSTKRNKKSNLSNKPWYSASSEIHPIALGSKWCFNLDQDILSWNYRIPHKLQICRDADDLYTDHVTVYRSMPVCLSVCPSVYIRIMFFGKMQYTCLSVNMSVRQSICQHWEYLIRILAPIMFFLLTLKISDTCMYICTLYFSVLTLLN
jgi:hypothetical protein